MKKGQRKHARKYRQQTGTEDTEAILSRRKFLIQAALASAGVGAVVAGCGQSEPRICLDVVGPDPTNSATNSPQTNTPATNPPRMCLKIARPPQPCLEVAPPPAK